MYSLYLYFEWYIQDISNGLQLKLNEILIYNNCSCFVSHQNAYNHSLSAINYNNYTDIIQGETRTQNC